MKSDHPWGRTGNHDELLKLAHDLGYKTDDLGSLIVATTHKSFANESPEALEHNERLEFLGDAVLDLVVADALMATHPEMPEGDLSRHRAALVSTRSLAEIATTIKIGEVLRLGRGEERSGGRHKESLLADALEAVIGAVYRDLGITAAQTFIMTHFRTRVEAQELRHTDRDFKTALQEVAQRRYSQAPKYSVIAESGPDHDKSFTVQVVVGDKVIGTGTGRSKKTAEREAACIGLRQLIEAPS